MGNAGRKPLPDENKKINITIRIRKELIDKLRNIKNYNSIIEKLIEEYLKRQ